MSSGLKGSANLQVLQLSHNKISTLSLLDFQGCRQLRELYLQGNLISTIHPLAFKDMQELQVTVFILAVIDVQYGVSVYPCH